MSTLIVEVCEVADVKDHPRADRLAIATVKGWQTCIGKIDGVAEFRPGDLCVYFPPDSILPPELANGPEDDPPGRLNVMRYLGSLRKDDDGNRPLGGRVRANRLRGEQSFGLIIPIDPSKGDDPNWKAGDNVQEHFGILKWEPPVEASEGDAERAHPRFHTYTELEHYGNFAGVLKPGEEIVLTEKIHGKNCRVGLILDDDGQWVWMAGSHNVRRKEWTQQHRRFEVTELAARHVLAEPIVTPDQIFKYDDGQYWQVDEIREPHSDGRQFIKCIRVDHEGEPVLRKSEYWECLTEPIRALMEHIRDTADWPEPIVGIVLFGEIYGSGVQNMAYGLPNNLRDFRPFDIAVNRRYLSFDRKQELFEKFGITPVPILYRGPYCADVIAQYTAGPTTVCEAERTGAFAGREGTVITPVVERMDEELLNTGCQGRVILKSVSADYLEFQGKSGN